MTTTDAVLGEAWMLTVRKNEMSVIQNGALCGMRLDDYITNYGSDVVGKNYHLEDGFPLLVKLIDAADRLSVQVHPDDEYAKIHENSYGKTEAWYILDCDEGAELIYGFNKELTPDEFRKSIEDNTFLDYVNKVKVKKGDVFFISAGTLHAIGSGILLAEVQQNCNTTYRVYDYNRLVDGKPRELHVEKALDVTNTVPPVRNGDPDSAPVLKGTATEQALCSCEFFKMDRVDVKDTYTLNVDNESLSLLRASITARTYCSCCGVSPSIFGRESLISGILATKALRRAAIVPSAARCSWHSRKHPKCTIFRLCEAMKLHVRAPV